MYESLFINLSKRGHGKQELDTLSKGGFWLIWWNFGLLKVPSLSPAYVHVHTNTFFLQRTAHYLFCFIWMYFWNLYNVVRDCHFYSWLVLCHYLQNVCILCLSLFSDRLLRATHTVSTEEPQILMHFRKASSNFSLQHSALWPEYSSGLFPQASDARTYWRHCRICT